jgi:hypothetical protein
MLDMIMLDMLIKTQNHISFLILFGSLRQEKMGSHRAYRITIKEVDSPICCETALKFKWGLMALIDMFKDWCFLQIITLNIEV